MILKFYELKKIRYEKYNLFLFYGKNNYQKNMEFKNFIDDQSEVIKYDEKDLIDKKDVIIEDLLSQSLFQKKKIILIKRSTDKLLKIIEILADKNLDSTKIIFDAETLEKKSKLRLFFEKSKSFICVPFYPDNLQTLLKFAYDFLRDKKILISTSDINVIVNKCNESKENLLNELEKIEFFAKGKKKITTDQILKLINLSENYNFSELTDNCLAKNKIKTIRIINENHLTNDDCIIIIRTLMSKLKRIFLLRNEYENNKDINYTLTNAKPPIFWKDKGITEKQILNWTTADLKKVIYELSDIELMIKKNFNNSVNLITDFLIQLCNKKVSS